jgi:hypothetical protein
VLRNKYNRSEKEKEPQKAELIIGQTSLETPVLSRKK